MAYTSDALKKEYKKETDTQRKNNLRKIREDIAKLSLSDFARETGITKNDLSMLENGDKSLSLFHIQAYKKFFSKNHKINLSVDFIMGFTDIMENNNLNYQKQIGLSSDAIETLIEINKDHKISGVINKLLADKEKTSALLYNIKTLVFENNWKPCIAIQSEDNKDIAYYQEINTDTTLGFFSDNYGLLTIDDNLLKSHSILKIQEILNSYKGSDE